MTGILSIIIYLTFSGFCFNLNAAINIHDNYLCSVDQVYSRFDCTFGKVVAISQLDVNSSFSAEENEEKLGKTIGKCYLNPLCFKLEIPKNGSR